MKNALPFLIVLLWISSCKTPDESAEADENALGSVERIDPALDEIIDPSAAIEVLSDGYEWSEGPVWVESEKMLLFSDVPTNTVYKWTEADSIEIYLKPSGYTGETASKSNEQGSNGLAINGDGKLVLCQHGDRRLAELAAPLDAPESTFSTLADRYDGKRFNSPNDVAIRSNGDYLFTDPPYGLPRDATQEIPFQGVYKLSEGKVTLLVDSLTRPNGIALTPGEKSVIIANSDPAKVRWYAYDLSGDGELINGRIFYDAGQAAKSKSGLPDGLKIDKQGNVFATGPGGVWIFAPDGKVLGKINVPVSTANCALTADEKTLFMTADNYLLRLKMRD